MSLSLQLFLFLSLALFLNLLIYLNYSRPKCVDEVAFQEEVVAVLKKSVEGADVSNTPF